MIDEATIKRQRDEFRRRLEQLKEEQAALEGIVKGYDTLLKTIASGPPDYVSDERPVIALPTKSSVPVGTTSMRSAIVQVMREARGVPLHTRDVLAAAERKGARTNAKVPMSVVDLVLLNLMKKGRVARVAPRTWRWAELDRPGNVTSAVSLPTK